MIAVLNAVPLKEFLDQAKSREVLKLSPRLHGVC